IVHSFVNKVVKSHFEAFPNLLRAAKEPIEDLLEQEHGKALEKIQSQFKMEKIVYSQDDLYSRQLEAVKFKLEQVRNHSSISFSKSVNADVREMAQHLKAYFMVLSGCGVYDGTEIHEASAILVHLSRGGAQVQMYAPDITQMHVIDHSKGQPSEESRNVLAESARIARGNITDLAKLSASNHDAVIFPGGFGAAKNLSTFAVDGKDCTVNKEVERVLKDFHKAGKPIGLCCISPVLAAKVLPRVEVTVGHEEEEGGKWPYAGTAQAITALGAKHKIKD
ncbi:ES1 protein, mitochondrial-like, partial [Clarias magur]